MARKYEITFLPAHKTGEAYDGETILEAAARMNVAIRADCGDAGICGKCRVIVDDVENLSEVNSTELDALSNRQIEESQRLACQSEIEGPIVVTVPEELSDSTEVFGKTELTGKFNVNPAIERLVIAKQQSLGVGSSVERNLAEWVQKRVKSEHDKNIQFEAFEPIRELAEPDVVEAELTLVNHYQKSITSVIKGKKERSLGVAFDIGTTTLAAYLCDLKTGEQLANIASLNPQRRYGEDVISRITKIDDAPEYLQKQQKLIIDGISYLIEKCLAKIDGSIDEIDEIVAGGNPTMTHILAGFHPNCIGMAPYIPVVQNLPVFKASELGIKVKPSVPVYLFPMVSGFIGGDTMAVIVADKPHLRDETTLLVDIGTNGEIVLGNKEGLWSTSCATGPALEGAQISCGMRAVSGAISKFFVSETDNTKMDFYTIGQERNIQPVGLCGTGVIDVVAVMRRLGITLPDGRFNGDAPGVIKNEDGFPMEYLIPNTDIKVMLKDIRQIQLAKSALASGIELLMRKAGVTKVDKTILTGAFGARFNSQRALDIGLLPASIASSDIISMENLAGVGAIMALLDKSCRAEAEEIATQVRFLDLSKEPDFTQKFAEATRFPELD
jgi:uncharacterized 2Fe-2S/4Fe-4S cluster protein (DUF4445 family)